MKKIYTLAMALGVGATAFAAQTVGLGNPELHSKLVPMTQEEYADFMLSIQRPALSINPEEQSPVLLNPNAPTFGWNTGTKSEGIFVDGIMAGALNGGPTKAEKYNVNITRNSSQKGYLRFYPYEDPESPMAKFFEGLLSQSGAPAGTTGEDVENYMIVNMTNPEQVYLESWTPYSQYGLGVSFESYCTENNWKNSYYGTFDDALQCITFPTQTIVATTDQGSGWANTDYVTKIFLDASLYADFSFSASAPLCAKLGDKVSVTFEGGADIKSVKVYIAPGHFYSSEASKDIFNEVTESFPVNETLQINATDPGLYAVLIAALDKDGNAQAFTQRMIIVQDDDQANWKSIGKAKYTEGLFRGAFGGEWPADAYEVDIEEKIDQPGYFRLKDPYANHPFVLSKEMSTINHEGHNHYLYINATNHELVYVEPSVIGFMVNENYGDSYASSMANFFVYSDKVAGNENYFGKLADNIITMPDKSMLLGFSEYNSAMPLTVGKGVKVELPADYTAAIGSIEADADAEAPVEYFNLQGMKIAKPEAGFVIVRQGSKVTKQYVAE